MNPYILELRCVDCAVSHPPDPALQKPCAACGGILDVIYDYEQVARDPRIAELGNGRECAGRANTMRRYGPLLPLEDASMGPSLSLVVTPVSSAPRLAKYLSLDAVMVKEDHRTPTGSLKDRASWLAVARARALGLQDIVCASTGNAASSLAGMAASAGMRAHILVPADVPVAKLVQTEAYGADVLLVSAPYDDVYYLCNDVADEFGWYNRNCAINPYLVEGKKTSGLEMAEQLGDEDIDWVVTSVGDGCTIAAVWKGISELHTIRGGGQLPRMLGVQAEGASPMVDAFRDHVITPTPRIAETVATAISVGRPRNATKALRAVRDSCGALVAVSDDQIVDARRILAEHSGVLAELGAAAAVAGLQEGLESGLIERGSRVALVITGHGLKDDAAPALDSATDSIPCDLEAVRQHLVVDQAR